MTSSSRSSGRPATRPLAPAFRSRLSIDDDTDPQVAALTGGGFVVAWQESNDGSGTGIMARVFDNSGGNVAAGQRTGFLVNTAHLWQPDRP